MSTYTMKQTYGVFEQDASMPPCLKRTPADREHLLPPTPSNVPRRLDRADLVSRSCSGTSYSLFTARPPDAIAVTISLPMVYTMMVGKTSQRPLLSVAVSIRLSALAIPGTWTHFGMIHSQNRLERLLWPMLSNAEKYSFSPVRGGGVSIRPLGLALSAPWGMSRCTHSTRASCSRS